MASGVAWKMGSYDAPIQALLNRRSAAGDKVCTGIVLEGESFLINMDMMLQVNESSGHQHRIRCNEARSEEGIKQSSPYNKLPPRSVAVDTTGDGEADSYFDATRRILCLAFPTDTTGDGIKDHLAIDTNGDGLVGCIL